MSNHAAAPLLSWRLQPLSHFLDDDETEDIALNKPGEAWVGTGGQWVQHEVDLDSDDLEEIAILAGSLREQQVDRLTPLCSTELPGGERLQICLPPTVPNNPSRINQSCWGASLTLRVHEPAVAPIADIPNRYRTDNWTKKTSARRGRDVERALDAYDAEDFPRFLEAAVETRLNGLLCGATGAGKTTLSKTIISAIPWDRRIVSIEDTLELNLVQPNIVRLLYSKGDLSGSGISSGTLVEAGMRLYPDIFLLQELRDDAAMSYLKYACSGHPGSWTTIHGRSPGDALRRVCLLARGTTEGAAMPREEIIDLITSSIDVIIPLERDGTKLPRVHDVWFVADAARRGETAAMLLHDQ